MIRAGGALYEDAGGMVVRSEAAAAGAEVTGGGRVAPAVASTAVIRLMGALPPVLHRRAARATYRARFFGGIVSDMPGPVPPMSMGGAPLGDVHPILPLADGVLFAVGALSWNGALHISVTAEPRLLPEAARFPHGMVRAFEDLAAGLDAAARTGTP